MCLYKFFMCRKEARKTILHLCWFVLCVQMQPCVQWIYWTADLSVHEPIGMDSVVWSRVWSALAASQPPPLLSHNSATSKAPLTFLLLTHMSVMFIAAQQHRDTWFSVNWTLKVYIGINQHPLSFIPEVTLRGAIINHSTQLREHLLADKTLRKMRLASVAVSCRCIG